MKRLSSHEIIQEIERLEKKYPWQAHAEYEGESEDQKDIYSITIGNGGETLVCTGGVHGRESVNPTVLVKMAEKYCAECTNGSLEYLFQKYRIYMVPLLNPDGYEISLNGFQSIGSEKYRAAAAESHILSKEWKGNVRGIDLNRNFPCQSYRKRQSEDFPLSERESKILVKIFEKTNSIGYLDFHSRGNEIFWYRKAMGVVRQR